MRIAIFSDAHGNLIALKSVLEKIKKEGSIDQIFCAGDLIGGGSSVSEMVETCQKFDVQCLLGNYEQLLLDYDTYHVRVCPEEAKTTSTLVHWMRQQTNKNVENWLKRLPMNINITPTPGSTLTICHASPLDCWIGGSLNIDDGQMDELYGSWNSKWIAFGHAHGSFVTTYKDKVLVNVSSVSQLRDSSSYATYCIFSYQNNRWSINIKKAEFDLYESFKNIREANIPEEILWRAQPFY
ncbi:metallophosphoesterase family protein [Paenibacillus polymyxa]|uniref:metallophosphoesterase family protein n=1 Tax=Paenibacillus polymyxa TaxID=1406 RepID=UPI001BEA20A6|nr:metallophosphoesterase family protein [Paenibacillus polymyxa]MBT2282962.1 metallophosphoesterase family protein [Paenibacillus polymyxa]